MNFTRIFLHNAFFGVLLHILLIATAFYMVPFVLHRVGNDNYGLIGIAQSVFSFCMLGTTSFAAGYTRYSTIAYHTKKYEDMNSFVATGLLGITCVSLLSLGVVFFVTHNPELLLASSHTEGLSVFRNMVWILLLAFILRSYIKNYTISIVFQQKLHWESKLISLSSILGSIATIIYFSFFDPRIDMYVLITQLTQVIALFALVPLSRRLVPELRYGIRHFDPKKLGPVLRFGGASMIGSLAALLYTNTSIILIELLPELGRTHITPFLIGANLTPRIRTLLFVVVSAATPIFYQMIGERGLESLQKGWFLGGRYIMILGMLPIVIICSYYDWIITCWVGESYAGTSGYILLIFATILFVNLTFIHGFEILKAAGKIQLSTLASLIAGMACVVMEIIFVKCFGLGLIGIALGAAVIIWAKGLFFNPWLVSRCIGAPLARYYTYCMFPAVSVSLGVIVLSISMKHLFQDYRLSIFIVSLVFSSVVYIVCVWTLLLDIHEKKWLTRKLYGIYGNVYLNSSWVKK